MTLRAHLHHDGLPSQTLVVSLVMREGISQIFDLEAQFLIEDANLDVVPLLWTTATVEIADEEPAADPNAALSFHGVIEEVEYLGPHGLDQLYRVRLRPSIHGLAYRKRTRIFQDQSVVDVIRRVFSEAGIAEDCVDWSVGTYPVREYITQWKESELDFVLRLLEEQGIFFWFEHTHDAHTMILRDQASAHSPIPAPSELPVIGVEPGEDGPEGLLDAVFSTRFTYQKYAVRDWSWETPDAPRNACFGEGGFERYEYPGGFRNEHEGLELASRRADALLVSKYTVAAHSNCRRVIAGRKITISDCHPEGAIGDYLLTEVQHVYTSREFAAPNSPSSYRADLRAVPASSEFRPAQRTPRPRVSGKESAVVTGPGGEEIHVDKFGRIKVHFYWDREGVVDEKASCWMRVQQQNTAGQMMLPRVGWEVDVGFLDGDPDRPIVLQKLYNQETMPPYGLPANLMQSSLQSSSSPGGGGTNELRMNDGGGGQEFFMHGQRDLHRTVGNAAAEQIGVDSTVQVGDNAAHAVTGNEDVSIGANQSVSVTGLFVHEVVGSQNVSVSALDDWGVGGVHTVTTSGARAEDVGGIFNVLAQKIGETFNAAHELKVGGALSINAAGPIVEAVAGRKTELVGGAKLEIITESKAENIGVGKILNAGAVTLKAGTDVNVAAEGALAITTGGAMAIKCGGDFGMVGSSVTFTLGSLSMNAGATLDAKPASVKIKGSTIGGEGNNVLLKGSIKYLK